MQDAADRYFGFVVHGCLERSNKERQAHQNGSHKLLHESPILAHKQEICGAAIIEPTTTETIRLVMSVTARLSWK